MDEFEMMVIAALVVLLPSELYPGRRRIRRATGLFRANMVYAAELRFEREGTPTEIAEVIMHRPMSEYDEPRAIELYD